MTRVASMSYTLPMDVTSLGAATVIVSLSLTLILSLMALFRRQASSTAYAAGYGAATIGFFLLTFQGVLPGWLGVILSNLLILSLSVFLVWGLRLRNDFERPWAWRFWLYLAAAALFLTAGYSSFRLRTLGMTLASLAFSVEFLVAIMRGRRKVMPFLSRLAWILVIVYAAANLVRICFLLFGAGEAPASMDGDPSASFSFGGFIFFLIVWAGFIQGLDSASLLADLEHRNEELNQMAVTDTLTGFLNRRLLETNLKADVEHASRTSHPLSLILYDLDHFKGVNDNYGHQTGDQVLKQVADITNSIVRKSDRAYRWGGEEFLLILPFTGEAGAMSLAEKLRRAVATAVFPVVGSMTISLGVAEWGGEPDLDRWFRRLDLALYRAKNCGRNRVDSIAPGEDLSGAVFRIEWQRDWETGNAVIDAEHKQLLAYCNGLLGRSLAHAPDDEMERHLDLLLEHARRHFANEEEILKESAYPRLENHARLHADLLEQAGQVRERLRKGEGAVAGEYFDFLVDTVVMTHMIKEDADFIPYLKPAAAPAEVEDEPAELQEVPKAEGPDDMEDLEEL